METLTVGNRSAAFVAAIDGSFLDKVVGPLERRAKTKGCSAALRSLSAARTCCHSDRWDAEAALRRNQHVADARRALAGSPVVRAATKPLPIDGGLGVRHVRLYGPIDDDGDALAVAIRRFDPDTEIHVHLNSPGGQAVAGQRIYDALRAHAGRVTTHNDGLALSAGATIFQAGDRRIMSRNAVVMIHDCTIPAGSTSAVRLFAEDLNNNIARIVASRSTLSAVEARDAMRAETWYDASQAKFLGLCDEIGPATYVGADADFDAFGYRNVPAFITETKTKLERFNMLVQMCRTAMHWNTAVCRRKDAIRLAAELQNCWGVDPAELTAALDTVSDAVFESMWKMGIGPAL